MRSFNRTCFVCFFGLFVVVASAQEKGACPAPANTDCVAKPKVTVGDRWVYRTINLYNNEETSQFEQRTTTVNGDELQLDQTIVSSKGNVNVGSTNTRNADRSTWTFRDSRIFDGMYVFLAFPLEVGKTWKNEYQRRRGDSGVTAFSSPVTVEGWEDVQVPAGKFRSLKIVHSGNYSTQNGSASWTGRSTETVWYAPEVKKFVKSEFIETPQGNRIRTELVEYEVK